MNVNMDYESMDLSQMFELYNTIKDSSTEDEEDIISRDTCYSCFSKNKLVEDTVQGHIVCTNCGQVANSAMLEQVIDTNEQYNENSNYSVATNQLLPQSSLGTSIGGRGRNRVRTMQLWNAMPSKERSLYNVFKEIQDICQKGNIPKCAEDDAKIKFKKLSECSRLTGTNKGRNVIIRGINRQSIIGACVYSACKKINLTRSIKEIANLCCINGKALTKGYKTLINFLITKENDDITTHLGEDAGSSKPHQFVERYCNKLKLKKQYTEQVIKIVHNTEKLNLVSEHTPYSVAAACILVVVNLENLNIEIKELSDTFNISELTIKKTYDKIYLYRNVLTDDELTKEIADKINNEMNNKDIPPFLKAKYNNILRNNNISYTNQNLTLKKKRKILDNKYDSVVQSFSK